MTVVRMLEATLVGRLVDAEAILTDVQAAGLLHVQPLSTERADRGPEDTHGALRETTRLQAVAHAIAKVQIDDVTAAEEGLSLEQVTEQVEALQARKQQLRQEIALLDAKIEQLAPWGRVDPVDVEALRSAGVPVVFAVLTEPMWQAMQLQDAIDAGQLAYHVCHRANDELWICFVGAAAQHLRLESQRLPNEPLAVVSARRHQLRHDRLELQKRVGGFAPYLPALRARIDSLADRANVLLCRDQARIEAPVFAIKGFIPAESQHDLHAAVQRHPCALQVSDPSAGDEVPVKLRNNAAVQGFEAIVRSFSGISYWEKDFSWAVGLLFAVFGSLCLLDAGYGVLLSLTGGVLLRRGDRGFGRVFLITGLFSLLVGLLGGQLFGLILGRDFLPGATPPTPLAADPLSCLVFSLVVGVGALAFSYAMAIWQRGWKTDATGSLLVVIAAMVLIGAPELGLTLGVGLNLPLAEEVALAATFGQAGQVLAGALLLAGLLAWVLWPDPVFGAGNRAPNAIWTVYSGLTGLAQDTMSHMRLFGIALSGSIMAMVINNISGQLPLAATVLFAIVGHGAVFGLALLSLYIHTNRLIFLEFGSKCIDGGQTWYAPMQRQAPVDA